MEQVPKGGYLWLFLYLKQSCYSLFSSHSLTPACHSSWLASGVFLTQPGCFSWSLVADAALRLLSVLSPCSQGLFRSLLPGCPCLPSVFSSTPFFSPPGHASSHPPFPSSGVLGFFFHFAPPPRHSPCL